MQRSIYLAQLIGPLLAAIGLGLLINGPIYRTLTEQFLHSYALIYLAGVITLVAGIALVLAHNVWVPDWRVIITVLGWLCVVGGVMRIVAPNLVVAVGNSFTRHGEILLICGFVLLVLGGVLSYFGYAEAISSTTRTRKRRR